MSATQEAPPGAALYGADAMIQTYLSRTYGKNQEQSKDSHSATWVTRNSPTTQIASGGQADKQGLIDWSPTGHYKDRRTTILYRVVPGPTALGSRGATRKLNAHSTPAGPGSWFWGGGPSPWALDFFESPQEDDKGHGMFEGLTLSCEPTGSSIEGIGGQYHWTVIDLDEWARMQGQEIDLEVEIGWGHIHLPGTEGYTVIYRDGNPEPIVEVRGINTHFLDDYRDDGSGNVPPKPPGGQTVITLWTGDYTTPSSGYPTSQIAGGQFTIPRCGVDLAEAKRDGVEWPIVEFSHSVQDTHSTAGGPNSHTEVLASTPASEFRVRGGDNVTPTPPAAQGLNPQVETDPSGLVVMTWTPNPDGFGYRLYRDGKAVAHSSDPTQDRTTFKAETDEASHAYGVALLSEAVEETVVHPEPEGPTDFSYEPAEPIVNEPVLFNVVRPVPGVDYSWDRTADNVADYHGESFSYAYTSTGLKTVKLLADGKVIATKTLDVGPAPLAAAQRFDWR